MKKKNYVAVWHGHHADHVISIVDLDERKKDIREHKPKKEHKLRLRLMKPMENPPPSVMAAVEAVEAWEAARKALDKAHKVWDKAWDEAWKTALAKACEASEKVWEVLTAATADPAVHDLHEKQCGCKFFTTKNIFTMEAK